MAPMKCDHCNATSSELKDGWKRNNGSFAQLCENCSFEFENNTFCTTFHGDSQGFRECTVCGKLIHCGCIVSRHMYDFLDMGGIACVGCLQEACAEVPHLDIVSDPPSSYMPLNLRSSVSQYYSSAPADELLTGPNNSNEQPNKTLELFPCSNPIHQPDKPKTSDLISPSDFFRQIRCISAPAQGVPGVAANDQPVFRGKQYKKSTKASRSYKLLNLSQAEPENSDKAKTRALLENPRTLVTDFSANRVSQQEASRRISIPSELSNARGGGPIGLFAASHDGNSLSVMPYGTNLINQPDISTMISWNFSLRTAPLPQQNPPMFFAFGGPSSEVQSSSSSNEVVVRHLFEKQLNMSDAKHCPTRLKLPKRKAEAAFPNIPESHSQTKRFMDEMGREWHFRVHCWLYRHKRFYILEGVKPYRTLMNWQVGDIVTFGKIEPGEIYAIRTLKALPELLGPANPP